MNFKINYIIIFISILIYLSGFFVSAAIELPNSGKMFKSSVNPINLNKLRTSFKMILLNNLEDIILVIGGSFLFSLTTVLNLFYNGFYFGHLLFHALHMGYSVEYLILLTAPHGIFEVPTIIIAGAAGFKIPYEIVRYLAGKKEQPLTKEDIKEYFTLALISIILIVIAAWVETYVTPKIAEYFLSNLD